MTWVVGAATDAGYATLISDIRVTWPNGKTRDCLQKVCEVGPYIAVGFSGSVVAGFIMVADLQQYLVLDEKNRAWSPRAVAENWKRGAKRVFAQLTAQDPRIARQGCQLLFAGAAPTQNVKETNLPRCYVWCMRSPNFEPEYAPLGMFTAIGSGSAQKEYAGALAQLNSPRVQRLLEGLEIQEPDAFRQARTVLHALSVLPAVRPVKGVSGHLHLSVITRGGALLGTNNRVVRYQDGRRVVFRMPPVANSYAKFERLCRATGLSAAEAVCQPSGGVESSNGREGRINS